MILKHLNCECDENDYSKIINLAFKYYSITLPFKSNNRAHTNYAAFIHNRTKLTNDNTAIIVLNMKTLLLGVSDKNVLDLCHML